MTFSGSQDTRVRVSYWRNTSLKPELCTSSLSGCTMTLLSKGASPSRSMIPHGKRSTGLTLGRRHHLAGEVQKIVSNIVNPRPGSPADAPLIIVVQQEDERDTTASPKIASSVNDITYTYDMRNTGVSLLLRAYTVGALELLRCLFQIQRTSSPSLFLLVTRVYCKDLSLRFLQP